MKKSSFGFLLKNWKTVRTRLSCKQHTTGAGRWLLFQLVQSSVTVPPNLRSHAQDLLARGTLVWNPWCKVIVHILDIQFSISKNTVYIEDYIYIKQNVNLLKEKVVLLSTYISLSFMVKLYANDEKQSLWLVTFKVGGGTWAVVCW